MTTSRTQDAAARARGLAAIAAARPPRAQPEPRPTIVQTCRRCGLEKPHKLLQCGRPRVPCVECARIQSASYDRADRREERRQAVSRSRRKLPAPELGAVVRLDCDPPLRGTVEGVDLNRERVYVRTRYGVLPFGFAEIKRK